MKIIRSLIAISLLLILNSCGPNLEVLEKKIISKIVSFIQKTVLLTLLFILYLVVYGVTALIIRLFRRDLIDPGSRGEDTFWFDAEGYSPDLNDLLRGS